MKKNIMLLSISLLLSFSAFAGSEEVDVEFLLQQNAATSIIRVLIVQENGACDEATSTKVEIENADGIKEMKSITFMAALMGEMTEARTKAYLKSGVKIVKENSEMKNVIIGNAESLGRQSLDQCLNDLENKYK